MGLFDFFKKRDKKIEIIEPRSEKPEISICDEIIDGIPFGYKNSWFVFKNADYDRIRIILKNEKYNNKNSKYILHSYHAI